MANGGCLPGYLSACHDFYTRQIVGWQLANHIREEMAREPLKKALLKKNTPKGVIIQFGRGGQYLSDNFKKLVKPLSYDRAATIV